MRLKPTYSSREVAALTGLSARQLQVWDTGGLLCPSIPPHRTPAGGHTERRYTPIELFELLVLADLRRRGLSVGQLHQILATLQETFGVRLFDATAGGGPVKLFTDGQEVFARKGPGEFYNLLRSPTQPLLVVGDEGMLKELAGKVRRLSRGRKSKRVSGSGTRSRDRRPAEG